MLYTSIELAEKYNYLEEKFRVGYKFLQRPDLEQLPVGPIDLGNGITAIVQEYSTVPNGSTRYETHDRFFDIQYVVAGQELFGVVPRKGLVVSAPYNPEGDITFYDEPDLAGMALLQPGDFVVVAPEEAHKPRIIAGKVCTIKKIVVKIPLEY